MAGCSYNDCLIAPIPEKCFYFCIYQILLRANPNEKREILKISDGTSERIFEAFNLFRVNTFEELARYLNPVQLQEVNTVFRNVTQEQLNYFRYK